MCFSGRRIGGNTLQKLRLRTNRDLPCGSDKFIKDLEVRYNRTLSPRRLKRNKAKGQ